MHQTVDEAGSEGVAAADAVDDRIDLVVLGLIELAVGVEQAGPAVRRRGVGFAERAGSALEVVLGHLLAGIPDSLQRLGMIATGFHQNRPSTLLRGNDSNGIILLFLILSIYIIEIFLFYCKFLSIISFIS